TTSALRSRALVGMQPQLRHTPPGRSSSTTTTDRPSWAQRMADTYPPGPVPTTATSAWCEAIGLDEKPERLLQQPLDVLQEARAHRAVHHPMVAGDRELHAPADAESRVGHDRHGEDRAHGEDGALGRIDDRGELCHVEHAEV